MFCREVNMPTSGHANVLYVVGSKNKKETQSEGLGRRRFIVHWRGREKAGQRIISRDCILSWSI